MGSATRGVEVTTDFTSGASGSALPVAALLGSQPRGASDRHDRRLRSPPVGDALAADYPGVRTAPLELQDWGPLLGHIWDPSGVLWHITQAPPTG